MEMNQQSSLVVLTLPSPPGHDSRLPLSIPSFAETHCKRDPVPNRDPHYSPFGVLISLILPINPRDSPRETQKIRKAE